MMKIKVEVQSSITGYTAFAEFTPRELLESSEEEIVEKLTQCDCEPIGETYVVDCNCCDEWEEYEFRIADEIE